ncbi:MAG TPA: hypothetical protein VNB49_03970, partial [Candidatus Dormibacteraeota bacterium]|nr:hypothetical protein [Candidatus Dormibacteraeota bacterium]
MLPDAVAAARPVALAISLERRQPRFSDTTFLQRPVEVACVLGERSPTYFRIPSILCIFLVQSGDRGADMLKI